MEKVSNYEEFIKNSGKEESIKNSDQEEFIGEAYWSKRWLNPPGRELIDAFDGDLPSARDLKRGLYVTVQRLDGQKIRLEIRGSSMPKTAMWVNEDGNYCCEHYSSKPGLETYGFASFDTPQELFRHIWLRIVKNGIPASLISKRDVNEKVDFDKMYPAGEELTLDQIRERLKPMMGGDQLAHPNNTELLQLATMQRLIELDFIGKIERHSSSKNVNLVRDISKNGKVKYYFYLRALERAKELYGDLIKDLVGGDAHGQMIQKTDYETWTVTNTQRMPINSVNFRTGENTLRCRLEDIEMFNAIFIAIAKRTFKRAKGKSINEKLVIPGWRASAEDKETMEELNDLLANYFHDAAAEVSQTVFFDKEHDTTAVHENAKAILIKYLLKEGSMSVKSLITGNDRMSQYVDMATRIEDIDGLTKRLINVSRALRYV
jgi:hypothetical protein